MILLLEWGSDQSSLKVGHQPITQREEIPPTANIMFAPIRIMCTIFTMLFRIERSLCASGLALCILLIKVEMSQNTNLAVFFWHCSKEEGAEEGSRHQRRFVKKKTAELVKRDIPYCASSSSFNIKYLGKRFGDELPAFWWLVRARVTGENDCHHMQEGLLVMKKVRDSVLETLINLIS